MSLQGATTVDFKLFFNCYREKIELILLFAGLFYKQLTILYIVVQSIWLKNQPKWRR